KDFSPNPGHATTTPTAASNLLRLLAILVDEDDVGLKRRFVVDDGRIVFRRWQRPLIFRVLLHVRCWSAAKEDRGNIAPLVAAFFGRRGHSVWSDLKGSDHGFCGSTAVANAHSRGPFMSARG